MAPIGGVKGSYGYAFATGNGVKFASIAKLGKEMFAIKETFKESYLTGTPVASISTLEHFGNLLLASVKNIPRVLIIDRETRTLVK